MNVATECEFLLSLIDYIKNKLLAYYTPATIKIAEKAAAVSATPQKGVPLTLEGMIAYFFDKVYAVRGNPPYYQLVNPAEDPRVIAITNAIRDQFK
jgi:hypothetical protein